MVTCGILSVFHYKLLMLYMVYVVVASINSLCSCLCCYPWCTLKVETIREWKNTTLPVWPYFVIKVQGQSNCSAYQRVSKNCC